MGSDFPQKTKKTIVKFLDGQRVALATMDLLTSMPVKTPRSFLASLEGQCALSEGEKMIAEVDGNSVRLRQGNSFVAKLDNLSPEVLAGMISVGGAGATVNKIHKLSKKVEVSLW